MTNKFLKKLHLTGTEISWSELNLLLNLSGWEIAKWEILIRIIKYLFWEEINPKILKSLIQKK